MPALSGKAARARTIGLAALIAAVPLIAVLLSWWPRSPSDEAPARVVDPPAVGPARRVAAARVRPAPLRAHAGAGAIEGVVVDEDGAPVPGAVVLVSSHEAVRSGPDGRFHLRGVEPGRYHLNAHSDTAAAGPLLLQVDESTLSVVVMLHTGVRLAVEVVSAIDRRPLPGARGALLFSTTLGEAGQVAAVAGSDGVLRFPVAALGNYGVVAEADGFAPSVRLLTWNDRAGLEWRSRIALEPGVVLTGRVVDESGRPVDGAKVTSRPAPRARTHMAYRPRPPERLRPPVVTDSDGRFRYPVPIGQNLVLVASADRHADGESAPLVAARPVYVEIRLSAGGALRGRVVDREGRPVARATVSDGAPESDRARFARTDEDGRFVIEGIAPLRRDATLHAEAGEARASPVLVSLPDGFARSIELVLEHRRRIAGVVLDSTGRPVPDAIVDFRRAVPRAYRPPPARPTATLEPIASGEVRADGAGGFVITGLGAGEVQLGARVPMAATDRASPPLMVRTSAMAGDEAVVIRLPAPARIRGRVVLSSGRRAAGLRVSLAAFGGPVQVEESEGRFELAHLNPRPGAYTVVVAADGAAERAIEARVAAGQTTDLGTVVLEAGRTVRGRVLDADGGGPIANARVSVDGPDGARLADRRSDELGDFEVAVPDVPVTVHAAVPGVGGSRFELLPVGRNAVELRLPEAGQLAVGVVGPAIAGPVTVAAVRTDQADGGLRIFLLDRDAGSPTFRGEVSPGEYLVQAVPGSGLAALKARGFEGGVAVSIDAGQTQSVSIQLARPSASAAPADGPR